MYFDRIGALLFDFDGTLIEPSIDFGLMHRAVMDVVSSYGAGDVTYEMLPVLEILARAEMSLAGRNAGDATIMLAEAQDAIRGIEVEAAGRVDAYAGVPEMLAQLRGRGYGLGIVTRNCREAVESILERIPLVHDVLLTRDDIAWVKPDPRHLLAALETLRVPGMHALMCGDHPMDIEAGRSIEARTVGVLRFGVAADYFAEAAPDLILARVIDLPRHLAPQAGWQT